MTSILIQFKVQDYSAWRTTYDENASNRAPNGMGVGRVFRSEDDGNSVTVLLEVTDLEKARAYADSDDLKQAQKRGGVIPPPTITWLNEA